MRARPAIAALAAAWLAPARPAVAAAPEGGASAAAPVADLPLVEVHSRNPGARLALLVTGDGGWVGADKALAAALAQEDIPVVVLDARSYFWKRKTPEQAVSDATRILAHYRVAWARDEVVLVGYSRGADVLPLVLERMPAAERAHVVLAALLEPITFVELEMHVVDLFAHRHRAAALATEPALRATGGAVPILCYEGKGEEDSLCPRLADLPWVTRRTAASHPLKSGEAAAIGREIVAALPAR